MSTPSLSDDQMAAIDCAAAPLQASDRGLRRPVLNCRNDVHARPLRLIHEGVGAELVVYFDEGQPCGRRPFQRRRKVARPNPPP